MSKQTIQDKLCKGLTKLGMKEIKRTTKYRRFENSKGHHFFVGQQGALRWNPNGKVTFAVVVNPKYRAQVLEAGTERPITDPTDLGF